MKYVCPLIILTDECLERGDEEPIIWVWKNNPFYQLTPAALELFTKHYFEN
jgi:hypothetical protein